jgi:hypothetical protein
MATGGPVGRISIGESCVVVRSGKPGIRTDPIMFPCLLQDHRVRAELFPNKRWKREIYKGSVKHHEEEVWLT